MSKAQTKERAKPVNIYGKLAQARLDFHTLELRKSGYNKFAGYQYFELDDFVVPGLRVLADNGLVSVISFDAECAMMTIHDTEGDGAIVITSPMSEANLKGCHPIQNVGAVETYQRRYLWMAALEIVEHDALGPSNPADTPTTETVTDEEAASLRESLEAVSGDEAAFCKVMGVDTLEDLAIVKLPRAKALVEKKAKAA